MTTSVLFLVILSAFLHAVWSVAIKGSRLPLAFNLLQALAATVVALALIPFFDLHEIPRDIWALLGATGIAHALYFYWMGRAFERGDLTLVYPIARSTPAFVPFVAVPLLGEHVSAPGALGIATVVVGLWLVHAGGRLAWKRLLAPGSGFAYLTLAATVAYSLLDKGAMAGLANAPWSSALPRSVVVYFLLCATCSIFFVPLSLLRLRPRDVRQLWSEEKHRVLAASAISFASYGLILESLRTASISYVVAVRQSSVLFVMILGIRLLGERPGPTRMLGAAATVVGVALIGLFP